MDKKARALVDAEIAMWEDVIAGKTTETEEASPLCAAHPQCTGCPVEQTTGNQSCAGTPYDEWMMISRYDGGKGNVLPPPDDPDRGRCLEAAQNMIKFLRGLKEGDV